MIDKFMRFVFRFGKTFSALFIIVCAAVILINAATFFLAGSQGVETPDFNTILKGQTQPAKQQPGASYDELAERRAVEKEFGDQVDAIVRDFSLQPEKEAYDLIINLLLGMDPKYRSQFVTGLRDFLKDAKAHVDAEGDKAKYTVLEAANLYFRLFESAVQQAEAAKLQAAAEKNQRLMVIAIAFGAFILFLIIPVLLQIEVNTRPIKTLEGSQA
jgi:hypothetical protein